MERPYASLEGLEARIHYDTLATRFRWHNTSNSPTMHLRLLFERCTQ